MYIATPCNVYDYGELFWWSTRLWQLFLLYKSWAVLLIVVVRIGDEILPRFQTPCLLNYQTEKFQKAICSRKSRHRAALQSCKSTPQPLTGAHGPGPAAARRGAYRFEPEILKKAEMQGCRSGLQLLQGFSDDHDDVDQRLGNNEWLVGYIYHYLYSHCNLFFGSFGRKECLNTPRPVHHELAVTVSHRAIPILSPQLSGVEGVDLRLALRRRTISVG